jgi:hypothetical protein
MFLALTTYDSGAECCASSPTLRESWQIKGSEGRLTHKLRPKLNYILVTYRAPSSLIKVCFLANIPRKVGRGRAGQQESREIAPVRLLGRIGCGGE